MHSSTATTARWREPLLAIVAAAAGVAIGWVDSRPAWDDTGITAVSLLGVSLLVAWLSGRWPLAWAVLVGVWTPILEIPASGRLASLLALAFTLVGSLIGYGIRRISPRSEAGPPGAPR